MLKLNFEVTQQLPILGLKRHLKASKKTFEKKKKKKNLKNHSDLYKIAFNEHPSKHAAFWHFTV